MNIRMPCRVVTRVTYSSMLSLALLLGSGAAIARAQTDAAAVKNLSNTDAAYTKCLGTARAQFEKTQNQTAYDNAVRDCRETFEGKVSKAEERYGQETVDQPAVA